MASNFKIFSCQNNETVHLNLSGDFDGSSACELIHTLKTHCRKGVKFIIDTDSLSSLHPFGLGLFRKDCGINNLYDCLTFSGEYGAVLTPPGKQRC